MTEVADSSYGKPLPRMEGLTKEFYDFCRQGECASSAARTAAACVTCRARSAPNAVPSSGSGCVRSGRGSIFTWTVVERALHPSFTKLVPYAPVVIEMEEGVRLLSQMLDVAPGDLKIGMPVQVEFKALTDEITLPYFRKA